MAFSKQFIELIKQRNRLEDVVSRVVPLRRAGSNMVGCCPFHSEKTPSFTVFAGGDHYYCFGCHAGGDVITFVMQTEGLDYRGAVERLAASGGVPMEEEDGPREKSGPAVPRDRLFEINTEAARFFRTMLFAPAGEYARSYLEKRRFEKSTVLRFGIGYAPDSWDALTNHMTAKGFTAEELRVAFLSAVSGKTKRPYDIFRNRLMFPVFDLNGQVAAFSGRRLNEKEDRKYINTSDTPVFRKSRILFGMHIAKQHAADGIILCEGAPDCIALHQAGFSNAAATLGTAVTGEHARMISRFTKQVYLAYDIDAAGRDATLRGIQLLEQTGVSTRVIDLGKGDSKDPDEFIKNHGAAAFRRKLEGSQGQVDYRIDEILSRYDLSNPDDKLRCGSELTRFISTLPNRLERDVYASRAGEKLGIDVRAMREEIERLVRTEYSKARKKEMERLREQQAGVSGTVNRDKIRMVAETLHEEAVIGILLCLPAFGPKAVAELEEEDFATELNRKVWTLYRDAWAAGEEPDINAGGALTGAEIGEIAGYRASREALGMNTESELLSHISALKRAREKAALDRLMKEDPEAGMKAHMEHVRREREKRKGKRGSGGDGGANGQS